MARQPVKKTMWQPDSEKTAAARRSVKKPGSLRLPSEEQIRQRAYQIFMARNGGPGDPHSDWTRAERELTEELNT